METSKIKHVIYTEKQLKWEQNREEKRRRKEGKRRKKERKREKGKKGKKRGRREKKREGANGEAWFRVILSSF